MKLSFNGSTGNFPDFLIVGAPKCGTTSLHHYLTAHPQVFLPKEKELYFWHQNRNPSPAILNLLPPEIVPTDLPSYLEWFTDAEESQIVGEVCSHYLYYHDLVIPSLQEFHPEWEKVKIIAILRDPLERVFSQYRMVRQMNLDSEKLSFASSIKEEPRRIEEPARLMLFYVALSLYSQQLKPYLDTFPHVKVFLFEDLKKDPMGLMRDLCGFLGVDEDFANTIDYSKKHNVSQAARVGRFSGADSTFEMLRGWGRLSPTSLRKPVKKLLDGFFRTNEMFDPDAVDPEVIQVLKQELEPEVEKVAELTGMDLSSWTTVRN